MEDFHSYIQRRTKNALKRDDYEPASNSDLATYNKTLIQRVSYSAKCLYRGLKTLATQPALELTLGDILCFIIVTALFPVYVLLRACSSKSEAKRELMEEWQRSIILRK